MAQNTCPDCGKPLVSVPIQGCVFLKCSCGYSKNTQTGQESRIDAESPNCIVVCGNCGGKSRIFYEESGPISKCGICGHQIQIPAQKDPNLTLTVYCGHCSKPNRVPANKGKIKVKCAHCSQLFLYNSGTWPGLTKAAAKPAAPSRPESRYTTVQCPKCGEAYRFPDNCGDIEWQCRCGHTIHHKGTSTEKLTKQPTPQPKPAAQPRPQPAPQPKPAAAPRPQPAPQPRPTTPVQPRPAAQQKPVTYSQPQATPCRTLTVRRVGHAYKEIDFHGLKNTIKDKLPITVYLDDVEQFKLETHDQKSLRMDSGEHMLRFSAISPKYRIPNGADSYTAVYFEGGYRIGPDQDDFRDRVTAAVLHMFRGPGMRERLMDSNNLGNKIYLGINPKGVRIYWRLKETKGFWQSLIGEKEEKFTYSQLGATPPPESRLPDGYWGFIQWWVEDAILEDESIDVSYTGGGFVAGRKHGLL